MIGDNIKKYRNAKNISQVEFAKIISVSPSTVAMWETNRRDPDTTMVKKLALFFNVSADTLLGITDISHEKHQVAFNGGLEGLTKEDLKDVEQYIDFIKSKKK